MSRNTFMRVSVGALAGLVGLSLLNYGQNVEAPADIVVDGACSLVDAINAANTDTAVGSCPAGSGADTIALTQDITLAAVDNGENGLPKITSDISIDGAGHRIGRADLSPEFRFFEVEEAVFSLHDIVLSDGSVSGRGGAISATRASVSVTDSTLQSNNAADGGAIATLDARLTVTRSSIDGNIATGTGGGIFSNGTGGLAGSLDVIEATISGNHAETGGGLGLAGTRLNILNSTISGNGAQGPDPRGGGIAFIGQYGGAIVHTTLAANTGLHGAGIWTDDASSGGSSKVTVDSSILDNRPDEDCELNAATLQSLGHNLAKSDDGCGLSHDSDVLGGDANLGRLANNGGPTRTHALGPGSDALDAIPADDCDVETDQRGTSRPQNGACDIGAFEATQVELIVDEDCSLVDAINSANTDTAVGGCPAGSDADTIVLTQDVTLSAVDHDENGLPPIDSAITVRGDGHVVSRDIGAPDFRLFHVTESGELVLSDVTVANGRASAGGAVLSEGTLVVMNSTVRDSEASDGGGIAASAGRLTIEASTISGNAARVGSGMSVEHAELHVLNSTVSGNGLGSEVEETAGGGLSMFGDTRGSIRFTTFVDNVAESGSGVSSELNDVIPFFGVLMSNPGQDCVGSGDIASEGYNVSSSFEGCGFDEPTDVIDAGTGGLGPLDDNGGPTETHALLAGHPAVNAIPAASCDVAVDQRGISRPFGAACDVGAFEGVVAAAPPSCQGIADRVEELEALGFNVMLGTEQSDYLRGTPGDDVIIGFGGNDVLLAGQGNDLICAGSGHDVVVGGDGADVLDGEIGNDLMIGGNGNDRLSGGAGADWLIGGDDHDQIDGGGADDTLRGGNGNDELHGGAGRDDVRGDDGSDELFGDGADDVLRGHTGVDTCDGGAHVNGDEAFTCETVIDIP